MRMLFSYNFLFSHLNEQWNHQQGEEEEEIFKVWNERRGYKVLEEIPKSEGTREL